MTPTPRRDGRGSSNPIHAPTEAARLAHALRRSARGNKHFDLQRYLGSPVPALGVYAVDFEQLRRTFRRAHPELSRRELHALARRLWAGSTFEERIFALLLLDSYPRALDATTWRLVDSWVDGAVGWGLCDSLGSGLVSRLLEKDPRRFREILAWTGSPNPWRRRSALYAMNRWVRAGETARPLRVIGRLCRDPETWVQRAVGTWLRECWKRQRAIAERFLRAHAAHLARVSIVVATERAPKSFRAELVRRSLVHGRRIAPSRSRRHA